MKAAPQVDVKCPACGEWYAIPETTVGRQIQCPNCRQLERMVPRTSRARAWRRFGVYMIYVGIFLLVILIYLLCVNRFTRTLSAAPS
jgi:DNA-directed RNA polymerase subunit RPC12/RpoP